MFKESIPCCYFPTNVIIIDDHPKFSNNLSLALADHFHSQSFTSPEDALAYLKEHSNKLTTLFTKHLSASDHYEPSAVVVGVDLGSMFKEVSGKDIRFDRPVVLIVDYAMPEMNGLELCGRLADLPYKKIILTGEADNDFAVEAFNLGKIDRFLKKGGPNYLDKIKSYVQDLNISYFTELSKGISDMLSEAGNSLLRNKAFIEKFNDVVEQFNIVEFYLMDDTGSYLLLDQKGNKIEFIVKSEEDMVSFRELAEDDGEIAVAQAVAKRQKLPRFLTANDRLASVKTWDLREATKLPVGNNAYYYSIVQGERAGNKTKAPLLSYYDYLAGR
jgi:CheY-like chemotaxis protein